MLQISLPMLRLQTILLTDEEKFQILFIGSNEWVKVCEKELATNTHKRQAIEHLKKLDLISITPLPLGEWHCIGQMNVMNPWVELRLTDLGSFIFEKHRHFLYQMSVKGGRAAC